MNLKDRMCSGGSPDVSFTVILKFTRMRDSFRTQTEIRNAEGVSIFIPNYREERRDHSLKTK